MSKASIKVFVGYAWVLVFALGMSACKKQGSSTKGKTQKPADYNAAKIIQDYSKGQEVAEKELLLAIQKVTKANDLSTTDSLVKALNGANPRVSVKALQSLGKLGNVRAVESIIEFAERKNPEMRRHAIEAVRNIGGHTAAAWLFTLSSGHEDSQVRAVAEFALQDVEKRMPNLH